MEEETRSRRRILDVFKQLWAVWVIAVVLASLVLLLLWNPVPLVIPTDYFLPLHTALEIFTIGVSFCVFTIRWTTRRSVTDAQSLLIGTSLLAVGLIHLFHALVYPGMPSFLSTDSPANSISFWLFARYTLAISLLIAAFVPLNRPPKHAGPYTHLGFFAAYSVLVLVFVSAFPSLIPQWFVPGEGLTSAKVGMEMGLIVIMLYAAQMYYMLWRKEGQPRHALLALAFVIGAIEEVPFSLYDAPNDMGNLVGHLLGFSSYVVILVALVKTSLTEPYDRLQAAVDKLTTANRDLGQFAYVASHDLQEPLRMISSYLQLLSRRYRGKLDSDADEFIGYAVDGANRLQRMINDLLTFSRVGTRGKPFARTDLNEVLAYVKLDLEVSITENRAVVTSDALPTVEADEMQLVQLLQNLVENAIKFRREEAPKIHVSSERGENEWIISVRDNGLGIDPKYHEKLFVLFQKLHAGGKYPGTGIGLAICKRVIERHSGRIWVESELGKGATFFFTIPVKKVPEIL